jgi:hypothetical protein
MHADVGSPTEPSNGNNFLHRKLGSTIRNFLLQYQGRYDESFSEWYWAMRLAVPELAHPRQLIDVFDCLSVAGIVELNKAVVGRYTRRDEYFFLGTPFTVVLTPYGRVHRREDFWKRPKPRKLSNCRIS